MYVKNPSRLRMGKRRWPRPFGDVAADQQQADSFMNSITNAFSSAGSAISSGASGVVGNITGGVVGTETPPNPASSSSSSSGTNWGAALPLIGSLFGPKPTTVYVQQPGMSTTTKVALIGGGLLLVALIARK